MPFLSLHIVAEDFPHHHTLVQSPLLLGLGFFLIQYKIILKENLKFWFCRNGSCFFISLASHLSLALLVSLMGRGKFKGKPTGQRHFSTPEEMLAGTSSRPRTFKRQEAEYEEEQPKEESREESEEESDDEPEQKRKGAQGIIQIENPNLVNTKNVKARDIDIGKTTELSRREREELEKQRAHERYMRLQEQGKTEQARKDLERLSLIRQQRAEAARKREEEKAAKEQKKAEARK